MGSMERRTSLAMVSSSGFTRPFRRDCIRCCACQLEEAGCRDGMTQEWTWCTCLYNSLYIYIYIYILCLYVYIYIYMICKYAICKYAICKYAMCKYAICRCDICIYDICRYYVFIHVCICVYIHIIHTMYICISMNVYNTYIYTHRKLGPPSQVRRKIANSLNHQPAARYRDVHLVALIYEGLASDPPATSRKHRPHLDHLV